MASPPLPVAGSSAVYIGFWINHGENMLAKPTLTMRNRDAVLLLAALSTVVSFTAGPSWKIWRFLLYCIAQRSNRLRSCTAYSRQNNVILRNSDTAGSAVLGFMEVAWNGRMWSTKRNPECRLAIIVLAGAATLHALMFLAASTLVAQIFTGRIVVSRVTPTCGQWLPAMFTADDLVDAGVADEFALNRTLEADNYVQNCYDRSVSTGIFGCDKLIARSISFQTSSVSCPYDPRGCLNGTGNSLLLDSGNITFDKLGINSKYARELSVRRRTQCTPMPDDPFLVRVYSNADPGFEELATNETFRVYSLFSVGGHNVTTIFTYRNGNYYEGYDLKSFMIPFNETFAWNPPFPAFENTSDTSLVIIRNHVGFLQPADDLWFSAHRIKDRINAQAVDMLVDELTEGSNSDNAAELNGGPFYADRFLGILACTEQKQFCNKAIGYCSSVAGLFSTAPVMELLTRIAQNNVDEATLIEYGRSIAAVDSVVPQTSIYTSIQDRQAESALQSARFYNGVFQTRLDREQWKIESRYWFATALARLQLDIFNTIEAPAHLNISKAINLWALHNYTELCGTIKFRSADHSSLSTVGLIVVLSGAVLLFLGSFFDKVVERKKSWAESELYQTWEENEAQALLLALTRVGENVVEVDPSNDEPVTVEEQAMLPKND